MNKVFQLTDRLKEKQKREQAQAHRKRVETLKRIVHCSACQLKCSMCGQNVEGDTLPPLDFHLCETCRDEFQDFQKTLAHGEDHSGIFWHNEEWVNLWASWIDFRRSIRKFRDSKEFRRLTEMEP
ncbi:MAG: hypothetical protein V2J25_06340 [Desulfatiglans sp.]|jgi:hypothetical protein|nr:hypothetical protein [Thermodesulfobacteriota bacterium]MEE4352473.1 hypothetical protein [Desulfatiglans sp.]